MKMLKMIRKITMLNIAKLKYDFLLLIMTLFMIISLFSIFIFSESNLEKILSADSENRTYTLSYPVESNSDLLIDNLKHIKEIEDFSCEINDEFGVQFIRIVFRSYKISEQTLADLKMKYPKIEVVSKEESWQIKIMKNLSTITSMFILITVVFGGLALVYFVTKIIKELNFVFCLLNILGYKTKHLFAISFYKIFWINTVCFWVAYILEKIMLIKIINGLLCFQMDKGMKNMTFIRSQNMLAYGVMFYILMMIVTVFVTYAVIKLQRENWREMA